MFSSIFFFSSRRRHTRYIGDWSSDVCSSDLLLDVVMTDFAERHGKARWCEKTPTQPAEWVYWLFPDAQVVHIVRDPRNVVASSLETPWVRRSAGAVSREWRNFTLANIREGLRVGP